MTASGMSGALNYFKNIFSKKTERPFNKKQGISTDLPALRTNAK